MIVAIIGQVVFEEVISRRVVQIRFDERQVLIVRRPEEQYVAIEDFICTEKERVRQLPCDRVGVETIFRT